MHKRSLRAKTKQFPQKTHPSHLVIISFVIGLLLSLGSLFLFAKIAEEVFEQETSYLDLSISQTIYSWRTPLLTTVMKFVTLFGSEILAVGVIALLLFLLLKKYNKEAWLLFFSVGIGLSLNSILKLLYQRPRPEIDPLIDLTSYSFPSGHAMNSFIFYSMVAYLFYSLTRKTKSSLIISCIAAIIILLIGFSRVYLGVHYPSDILAGYIAGFFVFTTTVLLEKVLLYFRLRKENSAK